MDTTRKQISWKSNLTMILAVAGSAIGFGNLLRFPAIAIQNGGGAFMIPYFICILLLGLPLIWIEWSLGRFAGHHGHGTLPGALQVLSPHKPWLKYLGIIGLITPFLIFIYYCYIESWTLAYTCFSFSSPAYHQAFNHHEQMQDFFENFLTVPVGTNPFLSSAWLFFSLTFLINFIVIYLGIQKGIERLCKWLIPIIIILCILMIGQIAFINHIDGLPEEQTFVNGFIHMWEPDFSALLKPQTWLAAAGQTFFTLSVGIGVILAYTSYLKETDDITLSGLGAASMNEVIEVIIGGSLLVPAIFMFFGPHADTVLAKNGMFSLSFITMPLIISEMPYPQFFSLLWFLILLAAGLTSTISLLQSLITFLEDEFNWSKKKSVLFLGVISFIFCQFVFFFFNHGVVDELDNWGGTLFITLGALIEIVVFLHFKGIDQIWEELHKGAKLHLPLFFKPIIQYVSPLFLFIILGSWFYQNGINFLLMKNINPENKPYILCTRLLIVFITLGTIVLIHYAWRNNKRHHFHDHQINDEN